MRKILLLFLLPFFLFSANMNKHGIVTKMSNNSVDETINKIIMAAKKNGFDDFSIIDHKKNMKDIGAGDIKEAKLIMFLKPNICSNLLKYDPAVGLDLPLRVMVYVGEDNNIYIKYRDPRFLKNIYNIGDKREALVMSSKLDTLTNIATE